MYVTLYLYRVEVTEVYDTEVVNTLNRIGIAMISGQVDEWDDVEIQQFAANINKKHDEFAFPIASSARTM